MDDQNTLTPARKPKGVLILQLLAAFFIAGAMYALCKALWNQVLNEQFNALFSDAATGSWYLVRFAMVVVSVVTLVIVQHRSQASRWIAIAGVVAMMLWTALVPKAPDYTTEPISVVVGYYFITQAPVALLMYFVGFSKKARAYFANAPYQTARS